MDQSPSPSNIVWDDAPQAAQQPQQPMPGSYGPSTQQPSPTTVAWDQPKASDAEEPGSHILRAIGRGFVSAAAYATGDTDQQVAARNKKLGLEDPSPTTGAKVAEFAGGLASPSPGGTVGKVVGAAAKYVDAGKTLTAARAGDKAGGTLGMQTGSSAIQYAERTFSRLPGGGALVRAVKGENDKLAGNLDNVIENLSGGADTSATGAGKVVESQLELAAQRMKDEAGQMYDKLWEAVPKDQTVGVESTRTMLKQLTEPVQGAAQTSGQFVNPKLQAIREALEKDISAQHLPGLPFDALKQLRTKLGGMIDWGPFSTDQANGQLKQLYGALTADLNNGAAAVSPKVAKQLAETNAAYAASKEQQEVLRAVVNKAGGPEKIFSGLMSGTKEGATTLVQVLANVDQPSRQLLAAASLERMGKASAGAQGGIEGSSFSADAFLTNWNKMAPEARDALFGSLPGDYAQNVTQLAANVAALKNYARVLPNNSNTAQVAIWGGATFYALEQLIHGNLKAAGAILGAAASTKVIAAALTNPETAAWLAKESSKIVLQATRAYGKDQSSLVPSTDTLQ
jgi:hypothetical protein